MLFTLIIGLCQHEFSKIVFPTHFHECADVFCNKVNHKQVLNQIYNSIVKTLREAAVNSYVGPTFRKHRPVPGWNKYVSDAHKTARLCYQNWLQIGKPMGGSFFFFIMK